MAELNKKILVVEDSESYLFVIRESLRASGFTVVSAASAEEGLEVAEKEKPDLILLDITLPGMDGIAMAKKLKESGFKIPIIFLTNMSDMKHVSEGMEAAEDYIVKADASVDDVVAKVKAKLRIA